MPKRNRHREAMKAGQLPSMKLATASAKAVPEADRGGEPPTNRPTPAPSSTPLSAENAATAAQPSKSRPKPPPQVTTPPLSPEKRREKARLKRKRNEAKHKMLRPEILAKLAERWPAAFPTDPSKIRPFAIGVHREIEQAMTAYSKRALRIAVRKITNSEAYLTAIAAGGKRYDLEGNVRGEITEDAKADARKRLAEKAKRRGAA